MSLMAGLLFGGLSAYGAFNVSRDPSDIKVSLREYDPSCPDQHNNNILMIISISVSELVKTVSRYHMMLFFFVSVASGVLSVVMGMRYKKSGRLMPAGIMSGLRSESNSEIRNILK